MKAIEIPLEPRNCECCGGNDLESVWSNQSVVSKTSSTYLFNVSTVICKKCGFCFSSPVYNNNFLSKYYANGFSRCKDIMLPYAIEPRSTFLKKYSVPDGILAEIGGDQADEFHNGLTGFFKKVINIELTADSGAEYDNITAMPANYVDVITHYDVLEHVPKITDFLMTCHSALKDNGWMICEVPNVRLYPRNLLLLEYEHVNHFSPLTLSTIAAKCGFELVELGHLCSRPFGFVAAYRKVKISTTNQLVDLPIEHLETRSYIQGAISQVEKVYENIKTIQSNIAELARQGRKITIWCVTELLYRLLNQFELPSGTIIVDTDPRRQTHLKKYGLEVYQPKNCLSHLKESELLVICSPRYKSEILEWIYTRTGKRFTGNGLMIMGTGPSGESLI